MPSLAASTDLLRLLADPTRVRLLALLAREELTVAELTGVTQLTQSRVSTHLGKLRDANVIRDRRAGASSFYALNEGMPDDARRFFALLRETTTDPLIEQDAARLPDVVAARAGGSWADAVAGSMERHYSPGRTWEATTRGLLGLVHLGDVLDVASGDGALAELVAPRCRSLTCLDRSPTVIEAARRRLAHMPNVRFALGDMQTLPFGDAAFDHVMLMNCLTYSTAPERLLAEASRVLRPGGDLCGVTLAVHQHEDVARSYDHENLGFEPAELTAGLERAGFAVERCEITSRERRPPHFQVITFHARHREGASKRRVGPGRGELRREAGRERRRR